MRKVPTVIFVIALAALLIAPNWLNASATSRPAWNSEENGGKPGNNNILSQFKYYHSFQKFEYTTPKVVEVPLGNTLTTTNAYFALLETETNTLQPYEIITKKRQTPYNVVSQDKNGNTVDEKLLYDGKSQTSTEFPVSEGRISEVLIRLVYNAPITTSTLHLQIDHYGKSPVSISLKTVDNGNDYVVIATKPFSQSDLQFPARQAAVWELTLRYSQPLRMSELYFDEESQAKSAESAIRFLMRPGSTYRLFSQSDGYVDLPYLESGNLLSATDVLTISLPPALSNSLYKPSDSDRDGIPDSSDNCLDTHNQDQLDKDKNDIGDACEDFDTDNIMNNMDNCPAHPNRDQQDTDRDGKGDHCDDEESRLTERLAFLPWLGIALGFGVVIVLFAVTVKKPVNKNSKTQD